MGDTTVDVLQRYKKAGLNLNGDFHNPPDHFATELEFMYFLLFKEIQALESGDTDGAEELRTQLSDFFRFHPGQWAGQFADAVMDGAKTPFYKALGEATKELSAAMKFELLQTEAVC